MRGFGRIPWPRRSREPVAATIESKQFMIKRGGCTLLCVARSAAGFKFEDGCRIHQVKENLIYQSYNLRREHTSECIALLLDDDLGVLSRSSLRLIGWSVLEPPDTAIFPSMSLRKSLSMYFSSSLLEERLMDIDDPVQYILAVTVLDGTQA